MLSNLSLTQLAQKPPVHSFQGLPVTIPVLICKLLQLFFRDVESHFTLHSSLLALGSVDTSFHNLFITSDCDIVSQESDDLCVVFNSTLFLRDVELQSLT